MVEITLKVRVVDSKDAYQFLKDAGLNCPGMVSTDIKCLDDNLPSSHINVAEIYYAPPKDIV